MFLKILKKDLKRNKTMNVILFLFIILATIFVASGMNNLVSVLNGTGYYLDKAGVGDYNVVFNGSDKKKITDKLKDCKSITSYKTDQLLFYNDPIKNSTGKELDTTVILQSFDNTSIKMFGASNEEVKSVEKGHVYISRDYIKRNNLKVGDKITIKFGDTEMKLIVDGKIKDAFLGSTFMGNDRFLMNDEDMDNFYDNEDTEHYEGIVVYANVNDLAKAKSEIGTFEGIMFECPRSTIILTYVMDLIVALVVMILSICLIIVSFVILRFSIGFTIQDDFREIGVMKAIGIRNKKIRSLYLTKYAGIAIVATVIGCVLSYPFADMLMKSVTENMVLGNSYGKFLNIIGAILVFVIIVWFAYLSTSRIKKATPVDAIRNGETGERFRKKKGYRISKSHAKNTLYLAWNDIISSPKRFLNIIISFGICSLFLLVLANTTATMDSNAFIDTFGTRSDLYVREIKENVIDYSSFTDKKKVDLSTFMYREDGKELYGKFLKSIEDKLKEEGMPAHVYAECLYQYKFTYNGDNYNYRMQQALGNVDGKMKTLEGEVPTNRNEIAVGKTMADSLGIKIGDTIEIDYVSCKEKCTVTGIIQTMNNTGEIAFLHKDAPTSFEYCQGCMEIAQITFTDHPSEKEIQNRKEKLKTIFKTNEIMDQREYCVDVMNALDTFESVELLLMAITIVVIILVTIMMERSFIANEKKQIAILKAIGFRDSDVIGWQVIRFGILACISVVIAMALSIPITNIAISPVFGMMGAKKVDFVYNFMSLIQYPIVLVAVTVLIAYLTALYSKTVEARDTASIE